MTAEIAILNRNAVALAADSAVTLQSSGSPPKIYNTNKLFTLSKYEPVGVMIYGNAQFMDVPWETAVKAYRAHLRTKSFGKISEYGSDFLRFIERNSDFFPPERQATHNYNLIAGWFHLLKHQLSTRVSPELEKGTLTKRKVLNSFKQLVDQQLANLRKSQTLRQFRATSHSVILRQTREIIREAIQDELGELATESVISKLEQAAAFLLVKDYYWENSTGVVIAGFGTQQFFPSMRCYEFSSIVAGRLRGREDLVRRADVTFKTTAIIHAFAQADMVAQFMDGIDADYREFIGQFFAVALLDAYPRLIGKHLGGHLRPSQLTAIQKKFVVGGKKVVDALLEEMTKYSKAWHSNPVIEIVHSLPKEELAAMAEALINLTSFKRHVTHDAETVGGPIDVAVVSRGDGLIWIKRKHYFARDLNPQFFANYYSERT